MIEKKIYVLYYSWLPDDLEDVRVLGVYSHRVYAEYVKEYLAKDLGHIYDETDKLWIEELTLDETDKDFLLYVEDKKNELKETES